MLCLVPCVVALTAHVLPAQQPSAEKVYTQSITYIKVTPGKSAEYVALINETSKKVAQQRIAAGEIISWTLLRSVMPAGKEARADYIVSVISEGPPREPMSREKFAAELKKAGVAMKIEEYYERRDSLSHLVAQEMWRPRERVGTVQKGNYMFVNYMKVHNAAAYTEFEKTVWRPMAEEWVKQGAMSGWLFSTRLLPAGSETPYSAFSVDIFPNWQAAFAARSTQGIFEKVHPNKSYQQLGEDLRKLRDLARRELWVVVDRVEKST